jgi:capsular polysaccharide biosynthesis protein
LALSFFVLKYSIFEFVWYNGSVGGSAMEEKYFEENEREFEIDLVELLAILYKHALLIILMTALGLSVAFAYTRFFVKPTYRSESTVYIQPEVKEGNLNLNDLNVNQRLVGTYTQLAKSNAVLNQVVPFFAQDDLDVDSIRSAVSVSAIGDTQIIKVSAVTVDPELSARLTNRVVSVFIEEVVETMTIDNLRVIDAATVNMKKVGPNTTLNTAIGGLLGLMLSVGFVFLKLMLDRTIHNRHDAEKVLNLPVLGEINFYEE